jgi:hypothetical protein
MRHRCHSAATRRLSCETAASLQPYGRLYRRKFPSADAPLVSYRLLGDAPRWMLVDGQVGTFPLCLDELSMEEMEACGLRSCRRGSLACRCSMLASYRPTSQREFLLASLRLTPCGQSADPSELLETYRCHPRRTPYAFRLPTNSCGPKKSGSGRLGTAAECESYHAQAYRSRHIDHVQGPSSDLPLLSLRFWYLTFSPSLATGMLSSNLPHETSTSSHPPASAPDPTSSLNAAQRRVSPIRNPG